MSKYNLYDVGALGKELGVIMVMINRGPKGVIQRVKCDWCLWDL